jgi:signal transduction histidine kinase
VPELDALGQALDATARRLDELVTRERAFSADASHQLRTPLAALRIELEAMQMAGAEAPEVERAIGEVDRLQATIDALLAVARDSPRGEGTTDVGTLLDEVEEAWRPRLAERARPLHVFSHDGSISAAPAVVRQIFDVLLDNALRHGAGAVEVRCRPTGRFVAIEVHDEGNATPVPESVFARRGPEAADGHGIGLALARSLAHAEGGRLALRSDAGGTTFTLTMNTAAGV